MSDVLNGQKSWENAVHAIKCSLCNRFNHTTKVTIMSRKVIILNWPTTGLVLMIWALFCLFTMMNMPSMTLKNITKIPRSGILTRNYSDQSQPSLNLEYPDASEKPVTEFEKQFGVKNELDGCYHIYLDVGSNIGIQVRKLFEPKLYPESNIQPVFDQYYGLPDKNGARKETVCAVGFEPNPRHAAILKDIEQAHKACGWRTHFYTETAAAHDYGKVDFLTDNELEKLEWGGSIVSISDRRKKKLSVAGTVKKMRLADYILERVITRKISKSAIHKTPPSVLLKLDIEGSELEVLTDMIVSGALQHVNYTFAEFHPASFKPTEKRSVRLIEVSRITNWLTDVTKELGLKSQIKVDKFDDETFYDSTFPLTKC